MKIEDRYTKIYSRPRIKFNNKAKLDIIQKVFFISIIAVITATIIIKSINPIVDTLCLDAAKNIATKISNEEATAIMEKYRYEDLVTITKDGNNDVVMIQANVNSINAIISDIPIHILEKQ